MAHHVSAIAIQAQAGLVLARSSSSLSGATEALEIIDREAARTLAEMRTMVGALRDRRGSPAVAPEFGIADIEGLSAGAGQLRMNVVLRGELADLPRALETAVYRVAQESVTNARRHAQQATRVQIDVTVSPSAVDVTVSDDGARRTTPSPAGFGLVGMTERVTLLGGTLSAGPNPDRGWSVRASLPRDSGAR